MGTCMLDFDAKASLASEGVTFRRSRSGRTVRGSQVQCRSQVKYNVAVVGLGAPKNKNRRSLPTSRNARHGKTGHTFTFHSTRPFRCQPLLAPPLAAWSSRTRDTNTRYEHEIRRNAPVVHQRKIANEMRKLDAHTRARQPQQVY